VTLPLSYSRSCFFVNYLRCTTVYADVPVCANLHKICIKPTLVDCAAHSLRNACSGAIQLDRNAGINDAMNADNASVMMAMNTTMGLYGFIP